MTPSQITQLKQLKNMLSPDWHDEDDKFDDIETLFRKVYRWHDYSKGNRKVGTIQCGSCKLSDTPKALYRILFLLGPINVDFSDMYKTGGFLDFTSPDQKFMCSFQLFKYEAGLRFYCHREAISGAMHMIQGGAFGSNNGLSCNDPIGNLFFEVVIKALETKHMIYSGNNFEV